MPQDVRLVERDTIIRNAFTSDYISKTDKLGFGFQQNTGRAYIPIFFISECYGEKKEEEITGDEVGE